MTDNKKNINDDILVSKPFRITIGVVSALLTLILLFNIHHNTRLILFLLPCFFLTMACLAKGKIAHFFSSCIALCFILGIFAFIIMYFISILFSLDKADLVFLVFTWIAVSFTLLFLVLILWVYLKERRFGFNKVNSKKDKISNDVFFKTSRIIMGIFAFLSSIIFMLALQYNDTSWIPALFCLCVTIACFVKGKTAHFLGSCVALSIIIMSIGYLIYAINATLNNVKLRIDIFYIITACLSFITFSGYYLKSRKFGLSEKTAKKIIIYPNI